MKCIDFLKCWNTVVYVVDCFEWVGFRKLTITIYLIRRK